MNAPDSARCKICGTSAPVSFRIPSGKRAGHPIPDAPDDCTYFECPRCRFCFTDLLDGADPAGVYDAEYWAHQDPDWSGRVTETLRLVVMAASLLGGDPSRLRVLDFGCGMGAFVAAARDKLQLETWGTDIVEPSLGREHFLPSPRKSSFDVIVACEVLEHLVFPVDALERAIAWLRPGGALAFQTAHYDPAVCGRTWWYVGPANGHVSLFSREALDALYRRFKGRSRLLWNGYPGLQAWRF